MSKAILIFCRQIDKIDALLILRFPSSNQNFTLLKNLVFSLSHCVIFYPCFFYTYLHVSFLEKTFLARAFIIYPFRTLFGRC